MLLFSERLYTIALKIYAKMLKLYGTMLLTHILFPWALDRKYYIYACNVLLFIVTMYQASQEEANGQIAMGLHGSVDLDPIATNCSSPASSSPSLASLEQLTDNMCAPNLEISLGRQDWNMSMERPEGPCLKYL